MKIKVLAQCAGLNCAIKPVEFWADISVVLSSESDSYGGSTETAELRVSAPDGWSSGNRYGSPVHYCPTCSRL